MVDEPVEVLWALGEAPWRDLGALLADPSRSQQHELQCIGRAGIALLLRDDCDDDLADTAIVRLAQAFEASYVIRGSGAGKSTLTAPERCVLLTPLRERQEQPWRHHAKVAELLQEYDRSDR